MITVSLLHAIHVHSASDATDLQTFYFDYH